MPEKIDDNILSSAIDKAEEEIESLKQKKKAAPKKTDAKTTYTKTEKKGSITKKSTLTHKHYKKPTEFIDNPIAKSINNLMDRVTGEKGLSHECEFGESVALTIDYYLSEIPEHPLMYLGVSGGTMLLITLQNKNMLPKLFGEKEDKKQKPTEPEDAISRKTKKQLEDEKKGKQIIIETGEYKKGKKVAG